MPCALPVPIAGVLHSILTTGAVARLLDAPLAPAVTKMDNGTRNTGHILVALLVYMGFDTL